MTPEFGGGVEGDEQHLGVAPIGRAASRTRPATGEGRAPSEPLSRPGKPDRGAHPPVRGIRNPRTTPPRSRRESQQAEQTLHNGMLHVPDNTTTIFKRHANHFSEVKVRPFRIGRGFYRLKNFISAETPVGCYAHPFPAWRCPPLHQRYDATRSRGHRGRAGAKAKAGRYHCG